VALHDAAAEDDAVRCDATQCDAMRCAARRGAAWCGVVREEGECGLCAALAEVVGFDGRWRRWFGGVAEVVAEVVAEIVVEAGDQGGAVVEAFEAVAVMLADVGTPAGSRLSETPAGARASCPAWISAPMRAHKKNAPFPGRFSLLASASISRS